MYTFENIEWELDGDVGLKGRLTAEFDYYRYGSHGTDDEIEIRRIICNSVQMHGVASQPILPEPLIYSCHSRRGTLPATSALLMGRAILDNIHCRELIEAACLEHARGLELSEAIER